MTLQLLYRQVSADNEADTTSEERPGTKPENQEMPVHSEPPTPRITRAKTQLGNVSNARLRTKAQIHPV